MKHRILISVAMFTLLLLPLAGVQAQTGTMSDLAEMQSLMDQMKSGQLDAESQKMLAEKLTSKMDGKMLGDRKFSGKHFGDKNFDKSSPYFIVAKIVHTLFVILTLSLLILLNAILYKKLRYMHGKKK